MKDETYSKLRPYQQEAVDFLIERKRALEYDDMGLGKTITTLTAVEKSHSGEGSFCFLILCPKFALYVWQEEIKKWFNKDSIIYAGTPAKRRKIWDTYVAHQGYLISTYAMLSEIQDNSINSFGKKHKWDAVVADEIHVSGLLNHKTQTYGVFEKFCREINYVYLLTGTPIRKGTIDAYAPLSIVNNERFNSYWKFVNKYCITIDTPFGKEIERQPKNIAMFRDLMKEYMVRRLKKEVLQDLPGKQRQIIFVDKDKIQEQMYDDLVRDMVSVIGDAVVMTPNTMTTMLRLRQLLVCPKLLDPSLSYGSALETIGSMGEDLLSGGHPFVIFTPFSQALPYIQEYLREVLTIKPHIYTVQGGMSAEEFAKQWQGFQKDPSRHKILLCVIKSGASFHATEAAHAFFLGYEWDFNQNAQSEDRLCRIGQKDFVNIYYLMHKDTVDQNVAQKLNDKQDASNWIIGTEHEYVELLTRFKGRTK